MNDSTQATDVQTQMVYFYGHTQAAKDSHEQF